MQDVIMSRCQSLEWRKSQLCLLAAVAYSVTCSYQRTCQSLEFINVKKHLLSAVRQWSFSLILSVHTNQSPQKCTWVLPGQSDNWCLEIKTVACSSSSILFSPIGRQKKKKMWSLWLPTEAVTEHLLLSWHKSNGKENVVSCHIMFDWI